MKPRPIVTPEIVQVVADHNTMQTMLYYGGYTLWLTDKVIHQGDLSAELTVYWYWAQTPQYPESRPLFSVDAYLDWVIADDVRGAIILSEWSQPTSDDFWLQVPRALCNADTLHWLETTPALIVVESEAQ